MSKLEEFGLPGVGSGILHPAMAHQFRVMLDASELIAQQVTKVDINMLERDIVVYIQQPCTMAQEMLDEISRLCSRTGSATDFPHRFPFQLELLDGAGQVYSGVSGYAHVVDHNLTLDYADTGVATHVLMLRYTRGGQ